MKIQKKLLIAEMTLLLTSVLIFRSLWLLLDKIPVLHGSFALLLSLIFGVAVTIPALRYIIRHGHN